MKNTKSAARKVAHKNLMAATWTKAAKVRRAFKAGRQRQVDWVMDAERAFIESRLLFINLRAAMVSAGAPTTDAELRVGVVLGTPPGFNEAVVILIPRDSNQIRMAEAKAENEQEAGRVPMGAIVWLVDREGETSTSVWVQPWLVGSEPTRALKVLTRAFTEVGGEAGVFDTSAPS